MKIKSIRFKNINSLRGEHEINFDEAPFDQSKLFAITGPTGSGKSTLLDVITLSLFNKVPRYTDGKTAITVTDLQKHGSLLTKGTSDAYTEVDYYVGEDLFRSKWMLRTNRNGKLVNPKMEVANALSGELIETNSNKTVIDFNESNIGLNYEQFIKSILLSQGAFDQFLKANKVDRGLLLEKITGVDVFRRIGVASFERMSEEEKKLDTLKLKLGGIELLSEDELKSLEEQEQTFDKELLELNAQLLHVQRHIHIKTQVLDLLKKIESVDDQIIENGQKASAFKSKEDKLMKHQKLLAHKSDIVQYQKIQEQLADEKRKSKDIKSGIEEAIEKLNQIQSEKTALSHSLDSLVTEQEKLIPIIENVRLKDKEIDKEQVLLKGAKQVFDQQKSSVTQLESKFKDISLKIEQLDKERVILINKLKENPQLEQLKNDIVLIKEKIKTLNDSDDKIASLNLSLESLQDFINISEISVYQIENIEKLYKEKKYEYKSILEGLKFDSEKELSKEIEAIDHQIGLLQKLIPLNKQLVEYKNEKELIEPVINKEKEKFELVLKSEEELKLKQKQYDLRFVELKAKFDREQLEQSFESLRANLNDGEPCPLCGSEEHPFSEHDKDYVQSVSENDLNSISIELKNIQDEILKVVAVKSSVSSYIKGREERLKEIQQKIDVLSEELNQKNQFDGNYSLEENAQILSDKRVILKKNLSDFQLIRKWEVVQVRIESILKDLKEIDTDYKSLEEIVNPYSKYVDGYHIKEWSARLDEVLTGYDKALTSINQKELLITQEKGKLDEIEFKINEEKQKVASSKIELDKASQQLEGIMQERKTLFGEKDPNEVKEEINSKISNQKEKLGLVSTKIEQLNTGVQIKKGQVGDLEKEIEVHQNEFSKYATSLSNLLEEQAYKSIDDLMSSFLTEEELIMLEQEKDQIQTKAIELKQIKETLEGNLKEAQEHNSEVSLDTLNIQLGKLRIDQNKLNQQKGQIFERLRNDRAHRTQVKDIADQIQLQEKEYKRWKILKDYIGDKEGNKFSVFAQELTLVHLIELANRRLKDLDERYVLQKYDPMKKEEDIIVLDTYQGNARRSVRTLSGGETFMISLAMALSLSDLASKNVKIDSLFIDEGFGTLDEDALDKALSTLEQLQVKSNKTIGIISHVVALKERIGTQIQLNKQSSGFSEIRVV